MCVSLMMMMMIIIIIMSIIFIIYSSFFSSSCLCSKIIFRDYVVLHRFFIFFQENSTWSLGLKVDIITHTDLCCTLGNSDWSPPLKQKWKASVSKVICLYIYTYICFVFRKLGSEVIVTFGLNTPSKNDFKICSVKWFFRCNKTCQKHGSHFQTCPKLRR